MTQEEIINFYSKYATQFNTKIGALTLYDNSYKEFVDAAPVKTNLLDLVCGPGNVSHFIQNLIPDLQISCVDLSQEMLELAKGKLKQAKFYKSDILNLDIPENKYDLIVCAFGLPYVNREDIALFARQISNFAHPETSVYISCMKGNSSQLENVSFGENEKLLIHYHQRESLELAFQSEGFNVISYIEQDYPEQDGSISTDMIFVFSQY